MKKVGVLSLQGSFAEHLKAVNSLGAPYQGLAVKTREEINQVDYLIIPGGESTTLSKLLKEGGQGEVIRKRVAMGMPVWGTCAGMILLGSDSEELVDSLKLIPIKVKRNAFGSQLDSFNTKKVIKGVSAQPVSLTFIRAPIIEEAGEDVEILLKLDNKVVAARKDNILVTSFHPELTGEKKIYEYFLNFKTP